MIVDQDYKNTVFSIGTSETQMYWYAVIFNIQFSGRLFETNAKVNRLNQ